MREEEARRRCAAVRSHPGEVRATRPPPGERTIVSDRAISDYALLSDYRTAALVSKEGSLGCASTYLNWTLPPRSSWSASPTLPPHAGANRIKGSGRGRVDVDQHCAVQMLTGAALRGRRAGGPGRCYIQFRRAACHASCIRVVTPATAIMAWMRRCTVRRLSPIWLAMALSATPATRSDSS